MHHAGVAEWHPILAARETRPGYWRMIDPSGRMYGTIELVRTGSGDVRYKAVRDGEIIGWATTLRRACEGVHRAYINAHGLNGPANGIR